MKSKSAKGNKTSEQIYHNLLDVLFDDSMWYRMPKLLHKILPVYKKDGIKIKEKLGDAAFILSSVIGQSARRKAYLYNDGWFTFSAVVAEEDTGYNRWRQMRYLELLEKCNLIEKRRASKVHGYRELKVNYDILANLVYEVTKDSRVSDKTLQPTDRNGKVTCDNAQQVKTSTCDNAQQEDVTLRNKSYARAHNARAREILDKDREHCRGCDDSRADARSSHASDDGALFPNFGEEAENDSPARQLAKQLYTILIKHHKRFKKENPVSSWTREFNKHLHQFPFEEFKRALDWYDVHIQDRYTPQFYAAKTFCEEFHKIKAAIQRTEGIDGEFYNERIAAPRCFREIINPAVNGNIAKEKKKSPR